MVNVETGGTGENSTTSHSGLQSCSEARPLTQSVRLAPTGANSQNSSKAVQFLLGRLFSGSLLIKVL